MLHVGLCTSIQCAVISEEKIKNNVLLDFGFCMQSLQVEQPAVHLESDTDSDVAFEKGICHHGREYQAEQGRG